jgi:hypothetical protein
MTKIGLRSPDAVDIKISHVVGLETYKALYTLWPKLYTYINNSMTPKPYFVSLVYGCVASSNLSFEYAGNKIRDSLAKIANNNYESLTEPERSLVSRLIDSSYKVENLELTFWENVIWVSIATFLSFWIIWYLYAVAFWNYLLNPFDGITCYGCESIFDRIFNF